MHYLLWALVYKISISVEYIHTSTRSELNQICSTYYFAATLKWFITRRIGTYPAASHKHAVTFYYYFRTSKRNSWVATYVLSKRQIMSLNIESVRRAFRGHSITTWTRWGGRGSKMSVFVHAQGIRTVYAGEEGWLRMTKFCPHFQVTMYVKCYLSLNK